MEKHFVNVTISSLNVSDGPDQYNTGHRRLRGFDRKSCKNYNVITHRDTLWTNFLYPECETTFEKDACCGSKPFDSGKFICCDGKLSKKYDHTCCGRKLIDPSKYGCCNDRKYDLSKKICVNESKIKTRRSSSTEDFSTVL